MRAKKRLRVAVTQSRAEEEKRDKIIYIQSGKENQDSFLQVCYGPITKAILKEIANSRGLDDPEACTHEAVMKFIIDNWNFKEQRPKRA